MTYEFKTIDEFVSYLDTRAKDLAREASHHNHRSHRNAELSAEACAYASIASMVRASNLVVVTDYMRAALSKAVA